MHDPDYPRLEQLKEGDWFHYRDPSQMMQESPARRFVGFQHGTSRIIFDKGTEDQFLLDMNYCFMIRRCLGDVQPTLL